MTGFVVIHRQVFDHPVFRDFGEASAFIWMVSQAAWKEARVRYKDRSLTLARGQLATSNRDLASRLGWTESKVRRFLDRLKNDAMIDASADAGVTVITLCNYDKYQASPQDADAATDTPPTHRRRTADSQNKEGKEVNNIIPPSEGAFAPSLEKQVFDLGRSVLGKSAGGQVTKLRKTLGGDAEVLAVLRQASEKSNPAEWVAGVIRQNAEPKLDEFGLPVSDYDPFKDPIYQGVI